MSSLNNLSNPNSPYLHITRHPKNETLLAGDSLVLNCSAQCSDNPGSIRYCWYKDGNRLDHFTDKILIQPNVNVNDAGCYKCEVSIDKYSLRESSKIAEVSVTGSSVSTFPACINPDTNLSSPSSDTSYSAAEKIALLIANEQYTHNRRLTAASNDVKALASTLKNDLHFKTISLVNLNLQEMQRALKLFCSYLSDRAYCLTYLAGHGFENDGQCYIVPTDAPKSYTSADCFSVKKMIQEISSTCEVSLNVILLDVCRKRNDSVSVSALTETSAMNEKLGNFVISFATMESGMAYEVKGQQLSVYASSLLRHLSKQKRVTRVLELVHQDIHQDLVTKGVQQPEFKSNMYEDRKLTDPIVPDSETKHEIFNYQWDEVHGTEKPVLIIFQSCGIEVVVSYENMFSNVLELKASIKSTGKAEWCQICLSLPTNGMQSDPSKWNSTAASTLIVIKDLQRLAMQELRFSVMIQYRINDDIYEEQCDDKIFLPFISWWNSIPYFR